MSDHPPSLSPLSCLQLGMHWFSHRAGGVDRYTAGLTMHRPASAAVRLLALRAGDDDSGVPDFVRFYARAADPPRERRRQLQIAFDQAVAAEKPDLVASHFAQIAYPLRTRRRRNGLPHVVHFHGPWASESRREGGGRIASMSKWLIERAVYARADRFICLSSAFAKLLSAEYRVDPSRIDVIPGGVDTLAFDSPFDRPTARAMLGWSNARPTVVCVRRLVRRMGLDRLIAATDIVRRTVPEVQVMICGEGPLRSELEAQARAAALAGHVTFSGFVLDASLPLVYRAADLTVVPSESLEGFGLTTIESLAAGTPTLVTPVGGLPEAVAGLSPPSRHRGGGRDVLVAKHGRCVARSNATASGGGVSTIRARPVRLATDRGSRLGILLDSRAIHLNAENTAARFAIEPKSRLI